MLSFGHRRLRLSLDSTVCIAQFPALAGHGRPATDRDRRDGTRHGRRAGDKAGAYAGGLSDGRFIVGKGKRIVFRTHGPAPQMPKTTAGQVRLTVRVGGRCAQVTGTLRGTGNELVVRAQKP